VAYFSSVGLPDIPYIVGAPLRCALFSFPPPDALARPLAATKIIPISTHRGFIGIGIRYRYRDRLFPQFDFDPDSDTDTDKTLQKKQDSDGL
jgi:hypothetical protein